MATETSAASAMSATVILAASRSRSNARVASAMRCRRCAEAGDELGRAPPWGVLIAVRYRVDGLLGPRSVPPATQGAVRFLATAP